MRWILRASCAIAAFSSSAIADGMPVSLKDVPPPVEHYNWSGLYFGAGGGFSQIDRSGGVHTDRKKDTKSCEKGKLVDKKNCTGGFAHDGTVSSTLSSSFDDDDWSGFGTLQVGYDRQIHNHLIIGALPTLISMMGTGVLTSPMGTGGRTSIGCGVWVAAWAC